MTTPSVLLTQPRYQKPAGQLATINWANPYSRGLVAAFLPGQDGRASARNLASPADPLVLTAGASPANMLEASPFGGYALSFDGSSARWGLCTTYPAIASLTTFSVICWTLTKSTGIINDLVNTGNSFGFRWWLYYDDITTHAYYSQVVLRGNGGGYWQYNAGTPSAETSTTPRLACWGLSFNGNATTAAGTGLYYNGAPLSVSGGVSSGSPTTYVPTGSGANLGVGYAQGAGYIYNGHIDIVLLFNRALTPEEFLWHYQNPTVLFASNPSKRPGYFMEAFPSTINVSMSGGVIVGGSAPVWPNDYYVRKSGSDSNNGLTPATAFLTINKAMSSTGANSGLGDRIWIGAGVYREGVTVTMPNPSARTTVVGDVDGSYTGDPGEVRLTRFSPSDKVAPSSGACLALGTKDNLTFRRITFHGGSSGAVTSTAGQNITFEDCVFKSGQDGSGADLLITLTNTTQRTVNWTIDRCSFLGFKGWHIYFNFATSGSPWTLNATIRNCLFLGGGGESLYPCIQVNLYKATGLYIQNCTWIGGSGYSASPGYFVKCDSSASGAAVYVKNCILLGGGLYSNTASIITEDYNHILAHTPRTNVSTGANSVSDNSYATLIDIGQAIKGKRFPRPFGTPTTDSPYLGFGNSASLPSPLDVDFLNRPRPSGTGVPWGTVTRAIGYLERHDFGVKETTVVDAGSSIKMTGPGDQELHVPVGANVPLSISVKVRRDSTYAGTNPQLQLLANRQSGVEGQTVTDTGDPDAFNTITLASFTPTADGWVNVRLISNDTNGSGKVYWDSFIIS